MPTLPDPDLEPQLYTGVNGRRLIAWLIDLAIILVLSALAVLMTLFIGAFFWPVLWMIVSFCYRSLTIAGGSATWGMRFTGIELRNADDGPLSPGQAVAHTLGYMISIALPVLQVISVVRMLTSARYLWLTDHILGTAALNRRRDPGL